MRTWIRVLVTLGLLVGALVPMGLSTAQESAQPRDWYLGKILFKSDRGGEEAIYAIQPDGSDLQRVDDPNVGFYFAEALQRDVTSADGHFRLFVRQVGSDTQIWQENLQTGGIAYIAGGGSGLDYEPAWAPDNRWVAYVSQRDGNDEIHVLDRQKNEDHRLTSNSWEWDKHPSWSPDGEQIVFWSNRDSGWKHIWVMDADGNDPHNISGWSQWNDWDPVWVRTVPSEPEPITVGDVAKLELRTEPTCTPAFADYVGKILFKSDSEGAPAIFLWDPEESSACRVDDPDVGFYYAEALRRDVLSPDGTYKLFVRQVGSDYQIWQENTDTAAISYMAGGTPGADYEPAWAPDGVNIAYVSQADGNDEIHLYNRETKTDRRLTSNSWEWDKHPSWSPDGDQIVFWSNRDSSWKHLWFMSPGGGSQRNVGRWGDWNDWDPVWVKKAPSPAPALAPLVLDPSALATSEPRELTPLPRDWYLGRILFKSDRGGQEAIYAVKPDGSDLQRVDDPNVGFYFAEALQRDVTSADGNYRLFVREVGGDVQIWQQNIQTGTIGYIVGGGSGLDYEPAWAPDNRWVAYVSQRDGNDEIHVFDRETKSDRRLTDNSWEWDKHPSWSPDGEQIAFWSNRDSGWKHIWVMGADGSDPTNITGWGQSNDWDPVWVGTIPSPP